MIRAATKFTIVFNTAQTASPMLPIVHYTCWIIAFKAPKPPGPRS